MPTVTSLMAALATDLAAIALLGYAIYFRRYHRRDLLLAYVALNLGVLAVTVVLAGVQVGLGLGLGLLPVWNPVDHPAALGAAHPVAEVHGKSALQSRVERKYMIPARRFAELVARLQRYAVLEVEGLRRFTYESVYFDTPDLLTYRHHVQGRRRRYKARTRTYLVSASCAFEVKLKSGRDHTIKAQLPYLLIDRARMTPDARSFPRQHGRSDIRPAGSDLAATVVTSYQRTPWSIGRAAPG
jgi:Domain of unknown function (DUF4956)/VTC domain